LKKVEVFCVNCKSVGLTLIGKLPEVSRATLDVHRTCTVYKKQQIIFHEGTRPQGVFCIHSGKVKVYKTGMDGKPQIIYILRDGDVLGYRSLISEEVYPVSAETLEESAICFIPKADFLEVMQQDPTLKSALMKAMSRELTHLVDNMTFMAQRPVRERLAFMLLQLEDVFRMEGQSGHSRISLSREDLANMVGTATETLIRLIHDYKEEGLVETEGRTIKIKDATRLKRLADI
jgi:CRP/FNR family transcriptional regulator